MAEIVFDPNTGQRGEHPAWTYARKQVNKRQKVVRVLEELTTAGLSAEDIRRLAGEDDRR